MPQCRAYRLFTVTWVAWTRANASFRIGGLRTGVLFGARSAQCLTCTMLPSGADPLRMLIPLWGGQA